jgi:hypothetical protein
VRQSSNQPVAAPNLNVAVSEQALGQFDGFVIVIANNGLKPDEMTVSADPESPVLCHPESPHSRMLDHNGAVK